MQAVKQYTNYGPAEPFEPIGPFKASTFGENSKNACKSRTEKEISASSLITGNPHRNRNGILLARPLIIKQHRDADGVQLKGEIQ